MEPKQILFISHDACRTGAPIALLRFLHWFKTHTDIPFQILLQAGGELEADFKELAPVSVMYSQISAGNFLGKMTGMLHTLTNAVSLKILKEVLSRTPIGLIYCNTAANGRALELLGQLKVPVICHVHELEYWIRHHIGSDVFQKTTAYTHHYIAVSDAVKQNLINTHGIPAEKIDLIYEYLPIHAKQFEKAHDNAAVFRQRWGIPEQAPLICASGTLDWRKGADLFGQLAAFVRKQYAEESIYFIWVGGDIESLYAQELQYDVQKLTLTSNVKFLGQQQSPFEAFAACDVFVMMSREDPFPIVCLEAAALGKPVLCFEGAGGMPEFVNKDAGIVVPYLDIGGMAAELVRLLRMPAVRKQLGQQAQEKVRQYHDIEVIAPKILQVIRRFYAAT